MQQALGAPQTDRITPVKGILPKVSNALGLDQETYVKVDAFLRSRANDPRRILNEAEREELVGLGKAFFQGQIKDLNKFVGKVEWSGSLSHPVADAFIKDLSDLGITSMLRKALDQNGVTIDLLFYTLNRITGEQLAKLNVISQQQNSNSPRRFSLTSQVGDNDATQNQTLLAMGRSVAEHLKNGLSSSPLTLALYDPVYKAWDSSLSKDNKEGVFFSVLNESLKTKELFAIKLRNGTELLSGSAQDPNSIILRYEEYGDYRGRLTKLPDGAVEAYFSNGDKIFTFHQDGRISETTDGDVLSWLPSNQSRYFAKYSSNKITISSVRETVEPRSTHHRTPNGIEISLENATSNDPIVIIKSPEGMQWRAKPKDGTVRYTGTDGKKGEYKIGTDKVKVEMGGVKIFDYPDGLRMMLFTDGGLGVSFKAKNGGFHHLAWLADGFLYSGKSQEKITPYLSNLEPLDER